MHAVAIHPEQPPRAHADRLEPSSGDLSHGVVSPLSMPADREVLLASCIPGVRCLWSMVDEHLEPATVGVMYTSPSPMSLVDEQSLHDAS